MLELQNWEGLATTRNSYNSSTPKESWRIQLQQLHEIQAFHHRGADLHLGHQSSSIGIGGAISPKSSGRGFSSSSYSSDHQKLLMEYAKANNTLRLFLRKCRGTTRIPTSSNKSCQLPLHQVGHSTTTNPSLLTGFAMVDSARLPHVIPGGTRCSPSTRSSAGT